MHVFLILSALLSLALCGGYGPDKVKQLSGYIDVPDSSGELTTHIFYWFFESRANPSTDPLIVWLTGGPIGPGCSSMVSLFFENGPYIIQPDLTLQLNPHSWNTVANVIWIDIPAATGWSYSTKEYDNTSSQVANDLYAFLQFFFNQNPQYNKKVYLFGEYYAGHIIPALGSRILAGNKTSDITVKLAGIAFGNGWVDPLTQFSSFADFLNQNGLLDYWSTFAYNSVAYPACSILIKTGPPVAAYSTCTASQDALLVDASIQHNRTINPYNILLPCYSPPLCYDFTKVNAFFGQPDVLTALGIDPKRMSDYQACNIFVAANFTTDAISSSASNISQILQNQIPVLLYYGVNDWSANYLGAQRWTNNLQWFGQGSFLNAPTKTWLAGNQVGGLVKQALGLTFLQVENAGQLVPMDQPAVALSMVTTFLSGKPF